MSDWARRALEVIEAVCARMLPITSCKVELNCRVCGKLCHRHEPGCTVPPGEIGGDR